MKFTGVAAGSYYVAVQHRNHFGIMSSSVVDLTASTPSYDFSDAQNKAWDNTSVTTNDAMKDLGSGKFGMWDGDANSDGTISYNGGGNDRIEVLNKVGASTPGNSVTDTYATEDVNMNGDVNYNGGGNDRISILNTVGASTPGATISQHIPQ